MPRGNSDNLIQNKDRTPEELRQITRRGGIKSGEVRRAKSAAKSVVNMILAGNIPAENAKKLVSKIGLPETELNVQAAILAGTAIEAIKGNVRATEYLMELAGEHEQEEIQSYKSLPARVLGKSYVDINRDIDERKHRFYDFKGGRGSLKSSFAGMKLVDQIMLNSQHCALAVRRVGTTLKDSVYSQITWAIDELGLTDEFHCTKNPMEIKRKSTGQIIYFRGADDPMKIKSIKPPNKMYMGILWIEEADQIAPESYRSILQSAMRGGDDTIVFRTYNTPRSKMHFLNKEQDEENPLLLVHHSHFLDAPPEWLGKGFYDLAEHIKNTNPTVYAHEYNGEAVGNGSNVFENVKNETITNEQIKSFDRVLNGVDWGYYPDPWAFVRTYFHAGKRILYIFDEAVENKKGNRESAQIIKDKGLDNTDRITCDSAEPKSVADYREFGLRAYGAEKGPGSVDYSHKWLQSLTAIVIDRKRCPCTYEEFAEYQYERNKDEDIISGYPDKDNHCIDAVRYATEEIWKRRETQRGWLFDGQ